MRIRQAGNAAHVRRPGRAVGGGDPRRCSRAEGVSAERARSPDGGRSSSGRRKRAARRGCSHDNDDASPEGRRRWWRDGAAGAGHGGRRFRRALLRRLPLRGAGHHVHGPGRERDRTHHVHRDAARYRS